MKSTDFLQAAIDVQNQRAADYDSPGGERSMGQTVQAFNAITGRDLTEAEGWLLLQVLKDVRQWSAKGYHHDSALDGVAYSALKAEALCKAPRPVRTDAEYLQEVPFETGDPSTWKLGDYVRRKHDGHQTSILAFGHDGCAVSIGGVEVFVLASNLIWEGRPE